MSPIQVFLRSARANIEAKMFKRFIDIKEDPLHDGTHLTLLKQI